MLFIRTRYTSQLHAIHYVTTNGLYELAYMQRVNKLLNYYFLRAHRSFRVIIRVIQSFNPTTVSKTVAFDPSLGESSMLIISFKFLRLGYSVRSLLLASELS